MPVLLATVRAALLHTFIYFLCDINQFFQKGIPIDAIEHMATLFFAYQDTGLLHKIQVSGDNRSVLWHIFGDVPDVGSAI